jgi:hypothetical protein
MSWQKITIPNNEAEIDRVRTPVMMRLLQTVSPVSFAVFQETPNYEKEFMMIYFSPHAATLCAGVISNYPSEMCGVPNPTEVISLGGHGDDMSWLEAEFLQSPG